MVGIVLASHGELAAGVRQTGSMVFGDQENVAVVSLKPSMGPDEFRANLEEAVGTFEDQGRFCSWWTFGEARRSIRRARW